MPYGTGRARIARPAGALLAALLLLPASGAAGGSAVVRDILVEDFAPAYPDVRGRALDKAMRQAVTTALGPRSGVPPGRVESLVSFVEVLDETIRPEYYAIRVSVGLSGPGIQPLEDTPEGPPPAVRTPGGGSGVVRAGASGGMRLGITVPRGQPGALGAYRALLAALDVQHVAIRPNPDVLLDVTVSLRRPPAGLPAPGAGIVVTDVSSGPSE